MLGALGVMFWYAGAGPLPAGTIIADTWDEPSQPKSPNAVLRSMLSTFRALAVEVSTNQSSTPEAVMLPNAMYLPSGDHCGFDTFAPAGSATDISLPSVMLLSFIETEYPCRCGAFVFGFTRVPARRSIGCAKSAIGG